MKKKQFNVYSIERRKRYSVAHFVGSIKETAERLEKAAEDVSRRYGARLVFRDAATDDWRRPPA